MPIPKSTGIGQAWFYHAPPKPKCSEPAPRPPISQINDLCGYCLPNQPDETVSTKNWIKESDSEYIRLAKMGGRPDLLNMQPRHPVDTSLPVGYPVCDWYYDSVATRNCDLQAKDEDRMGEPYVFKVPAYMTHPDPQPRQSTDGYVPPSSQMAPPGECEQHATNLSNNCSGLQAKKKTSVKKVARKPVRIESPPIV